MYGAAELNQERGRVSEYTSINNEGFLKMASWVCHWFSIEDDADKTRRTHNLQPYAKDLFVSTINKNCKIK